MEGWESRESVLQSRDTIRIDGTRNTGLNKYITNFAKKQNCYF